MTTLKSNQEVKITRDVSKFLIGVRARIRRISPSGTLTVELLEDSKNGAAWKMGHLMHLQPYNVEAINHGPS